MKKLIFGIYADCYDGRVGQTSPYIQYFSQFGYVRMISTLDKLDNIENEIDVLIMPGGADILASNYSAIPGVYDGRVNQHYEYLDNVLIPKFVNSKKPIIAICRGMQRINTYFGGTLIQHIVGHKQDGNRAAETQEMQLLNGESYKINTLHHQCVDKLGEGFELYGWSLAYQGYTEYSNIKSWKVNQKDGTVKVKEVYVIPEIIIHKELPIYCTQFHPKLWGFC